MREGPEKVGSYLIVNVIKMEIENRKGQERH